MRTLFLVAGLAVLVSGCSRKQPQSKPPDPGPGQEATLATSPAPAHAPGLDGSALPEPSKQGLVDLSSDSNPYISNIAKRALSSWQGRDYKAVALGIGKLVALCKSTGQQQALTSSLAQLKLEVERAAAKGNANAKEALAQLARQQL